MRQVTPQRVAFAAIASLSLGLTVAALLGGFATDFPMRQIQALAVFTFGAVCIFGPMMWVGLKMTDYRHPENEADFEELVKRSERLAAGEEEPGDYDDFEDDFDEEEDSLAWSDFDPEDEGDFDLLVRAALD